MGSPEADKPRGSDLKICPYIQRQSSSVLFSLEKSLVIPALASPMSIPLIITDNPLLLGHFTGRETEDESNRGAS